MGVLHIIVDEPTGQVMVQERYWTIDSEGVRIRETALRFAVRYKSRAMTKQQALERADEFLSRAKPTYD